MRARFRRRLDLLLGLAGAFPLLFSFTGCKCSDEQPAPAASTVASAFAQPPRLPPLAGPAWTNLEDGDTAEKTASPFGVWVPLGATKPRPIVVLLGGLAGAEPSAARLPAQLFDRLEHDVFVMAVGDAPSSASTMLRSALTKLKARYGAHVAPGSVLLVATGPYAAEAAALMREEPSFFARAVFFDFDPTLWSNTMSFVLARRGAKGVLFTTSDEARRAGVEHAASITQRAGTPARALFTPVASMPPEQGVHPEVAAAAFAELPWLLQGDTRFPQLPVAAAAPSPGTSASVAVPVAPKIPTVAGPAPGASPGRASAPRPASMPSAAASGTTRPAAAPSPGSAH